MVGRYRLVVWNRNVKYDFEIDRMVTILRGDSGTGKSLLYSMVLDKDDVNINCNVPVYAASGTLLWKEELRRLKDTIIIIDENVGILNDPEFCSIVNEQRNYYILITRRDFENIAYSVKSIYKLKETRMNNLSQSFTLNMLEHMYDDSAVAKMPDAFVTEDSNSGNQFFKKCFKNIPCLSAKGKSNVGTCLRSLGSEYNNVVVFIDGAAFGSNIDEVVGVMSLLTYNVFVIMPESFEYLLLKAGTVSCEDKYLNKPFNYADDKTFVNEFGGRIKKGCNIISWERYFTVLLERMSERSGISYKKSSLSLYFLRQRVSILSAIKDLIM